MTTTDEKKSSWPWPWTKKEELQWGQFISTKYGQITLLDRKIHKHLITNKYDKTISDEDFRLGLRRRCLAEPISEDVQTVVTENKLNPAKATFHCNVCNVVSKTRCGGCSAVFYCGRECQKSDWKAHKSDCKMFKKKKETYFAPPEKEEENVEGYINGFSPDECQELMCQGVKPWDDDADAVMSVLRGGDDDYYDYGDDDDDDDDDSDDNDEEDEEEEEEEEIEEGEIVEEGEESKVLYKNIEDVDDVEDVDEDKVEDNDEH
mmetsp:Transcript_28990/g.27773  ORF Transcript_28990/g.27773 Transcript_28990/m.27773 type:complete len:262 (-) Transcript_28990:97-882(-)|eukprot:CAMPEP_0119043024 /NCGR_PEP_ID=MMETSP1177-20130426/16355_1 /TAXON_ID=2985 /ORGANISM="Ochromonas sp, Strain CCMP1899" /LENGTH=261 /DNA_ID=CAMNT_0007010189 /DNA_START=68 /DNA_END=853 /DNA_ORIENTATION=+